MFNEGKKQGIEQNKMENAKSLLKNGASEELILKSIDITQEQLNEIKEPL